MRICVVQMQSVAGDVSVNIKAHKKFIDHALANQADVVIFPELSITNYEPSLAKALAMDVEDGRFLPFQRLSDTHTLTIGVGVPTKDSAGLYISMVLFQPHQAPKTYSKKYLHADEKPYFVSGENFPILPINQNNVAIAICYELSVQEHAETAFAHHPDLYVASVAKSARGVKSAHQRLAEIANQFGVPVLMANNLGLADDFMGAGNTAVWDKTGRRLAQLDDANEGFIIFDTETQEVIEKVI